MRAAAALAVAFFLPLAGAQTPAPEAKISRLALVIGNGAYRDVPLPNAINDAADVAKALEASGFTVIKRENASLRDMHLALREFGDRLGRQTTGLFYFAGHGLQVRGRNYLLPVDADVAREDEVAFAALDLGAVMEKLDSAKNPVNIVVLDACRNNPFGNRITTTSKGLAQVDAPPGTLIAFATAPGSTAADGRGRNGLYTFHLVRQIERPGIPIEEVFKSVRASVRSESQNLQVPWESTSLESEFFFRKPPPAPAPPPAEKSDRVAAVGSSSARSVQASVNAPPSFVPGDRWSIRVVNELDGSERTWQMSVKELRGDEVHYSNGNVTDLLGNSIRIMKSGGAMELFFPSTQNYLFPMKAGNSWDLKSMQQAGDRIFDLQVRLTVVGEEEVEVPAGRMRAIRLDRVVQWKQRDNNNAGTNTVSYWYNGAVKRWVLLTEKNVTAKGKVIRQERSELLSYSVK